MAGVDLDLLVLGSGVAGLSAAVRAADTHGMRVGVLTKGELHQATTRWAQGGVAAVGVALLRLDGDAGVVADSLTEAGEGVKQSRLAGVRVADEGDS